MLRGNIKNLMSLLYSFGGQTKGRKNYINIVKLIQNEQQLSTQESNPAAKNMFKKRNQQKNYQNIESGLEIDQQDWIPKGEEKTQHMSTQQQQMNYKIKTAIRCQTLYYECLKKKHKLELRQYALIFCKILELRRMNPTQRKQMQDFTNFLSILSNKIQDMPPEQLVRIVYGMKQQRVSVDDMKLMLLIVQKIINEFSNTQNNQLEPKSFETLRLSTSIKLFYSLLYILSQTGSHFEKKLKSFMNETLTHILFRSMKTKKHSKTGEYFPLKLKIAFLHSCKVIEASNTCVKNLILSILVEKERVTLQTLLELQKTLFENKQLLEKTRKQLFTEKDIHIKYNILYRIEKYINDAIPTNLKKSSNYSELNSKLASHLHYISQLTFQELNVMEMNSFKDEQQFRILALFHHAYKNALIENYSSLSEKDDIVKFFNQNQNEAYTLFELLNFFYDKLKLDNGNSLRPSVKKELKEFMSLLCKFYGKVNFLTQSVIIDILVLSNFTNLKPILTEFLEINTLSGSSKKQQKLHFLRKDKTLMMNHFFTIIKYQKIFQQHCSSQYQLFINSNIKLILKQIFKSTQPANIEKYAFYLSKYCNVLTQQTLPLFIQSIINTYTRISWINRSFKKSDVDIIYKHKQHFLSTSTKQSIQMQNQTDIFGENVNEKEQRQFAFNENMLSILQNDKQLFREFYRIEQKIRVKLRMALKNFKFMILLFENIKLNVGKQIWESKINEKLISSLLLNFKSELECLKFERFLTKENCSDLTEIHELLRDIWDNALPEVEIRNEALVYEHEQSKSKPSVSTNEKVQQQKNQPSNETITNININQTQQVISTQNLKSNQQNIQQKEQIINEQVEEEESQQSEYTEQVEYLQGKDFYKLQAFKDYQQKQDKNALYFYNKNKEILQEIKTLTCDFSQLTKTIKGDNESSLKLLKNLQEFYSKSDEKVHSRQQAQQQLQQRRKIIDLATIDDMRVERQNMDELVNLEVENRDNKQLYSLRVFRKSYPSLVHFAILQENQHNNEKKLSQVLEQVLYVNSSKIRKNYKKKKAEESKVIENSESDDKKNGPSQILNQTNISNSDTSSK